MDLVVGLGPKLLARRRLFFLDGDDELQGDTNEDTLYRLQSDLEAHEDLPIARRSFLARQRHSFN